MGHPGQYHLKNNPSNCSCSKTSIMLAVNFSLRSADAEILIMFADASQRANSPITFTPTLRRFLAYTIVAGEHKFTKCTIIRICIHSPLAVGETETTSLVVLNSKISK